MFALYASDHVKHALFTVIIALLAYQGIFHSLQINVSLNAPLDISEIQQNQIAIYAHHNAFLAWLPQHIALVVLRATNCTLFK